MKALNKKNAPSLSIVKIIATLTPLVIIFLTKVSETLGRADRAQTPSLLWRSECGDPAPPSYGYTLGCTQETLD